MKKIILSIILCLTILIQLVPMTGAAESALENVLYTINYTTGHTSISFDGALPLTGTVILVLNPGVTPEDALNENAIQYQYDVTADENGSVKHSFVLNIDEVPVNDEYYDVYVKIPGREAEKITSLCYVGINGRADIVNTLKGNTEDILNLLNDNEACMAVGIYGFKPFELVNKSLLAERMTGKFSSFTNSTTAFDKVCRYVKEFCVLELYNQNMPSEVYGEDDVYLWEDALSFDAFDDENGATFNDCYKNVISEEAQKKVRDELFGKDIETPEALMKQFAVDTVLVGLTNPQNVGYAHVEKLLTKENCDVIGLSLSKNLTGDEEVEIAAYKGNFETVKELEEYIEDLFDDRKSSGSKDSGGRGSGSSIGTAPFSVDAGFVPPATTPAKANVFDDLDENHWAFTPVVYLKSKGVVNGVDGNLFSPNGKVTREQFIKMLFAILDIEPEEKTETGFVDVDASAWYAPYVCAAVENGIITGISDTEFGTGMYATRQDICTMLYRAMKTDTTNYKDFTDKEFIADYAYDAVGTLGANGIVNGYPDGSFKPEAVCTRAEAASLIYNAAMYMEVK